ncbi:MAG: flagellar motor stator protein MotA [Pseudomonadota bacterium]|nr:flagellar motor stator protein MotA [Pseudomonadota bacterium]
MLVIVGAIIVITAVVSGYLMEHGNLSVLFQPAELVIIGGAAIGAFIIASPMKTVKAVIQGVLGVVRSKTYSKEDYLEAMLLLNGIFYKIRQQGLVAIESDVDEPEKSSLFNRFPGILKNNRAMGLITDTLRMVMTTTIATHELESLLEGEIDTHYEEMIVPSKTVTFIADGLPGLGIVAAVLGVVLTMGKIGEPPEILGHSIGAALVGTFLGVLLCYGFVGPLGRHMEHAVQEELQYLTVFKVALVAFVGGAAPKVALEFGRRVIPHDSKPLFSEVENLLRQAKK